MDFEVDSLGDAPSLEWKKSARRRSSTGSRKVPRRSVLSESTNRHNNAADDAEADSDGDLCHKTDPERGETWLARWGELVGALPAIDDDVPPDAFRGAARELLRRGVEIVDAADAEDAAGRDALVLRFVDGSEGRVSLPPPFDDPFSFANDYLPLYGPLRGFQVDAIAALHERRDVLLAVRCGAGKSLPPAMVAAARARDALDRGAQQVCVWTAPTQALVADKVDDLQGRYGEGWRNAGGRGDFAAAVAGLERGRARRRRRPRGVVRAAARGHHLLVVIDECDEEVGNDDSFRRSQEAQGRTIQACFALAGAKAPVVALSGTLSKFEVGSLLEALGLPPAPATLVIRTASPINSMVDIHTGDGGGVADYVRDAAPAPRSSRGPSGARRRQAARSSSFPRAALFAVAGIIVDDAKKLAEFTDLVRLFESVRFCWRSVAAHVLGDVAAPLLAAPVPACCPACSAALEAREAGVPAVEAIDVPEIRALLSDCPEPDLLSDDPHALRAEIEHLQKKLAAEKTKGLASTHTETFDKGVRECDILFGKELESLLVDNACVTARAKFGGSDRSSASMTHFTVRVLLRIQLAARRLDDAMPKFVCVQRDAYGLYGHTFASLVTGARSCSAVEMCLPKVVGPPRVEEPATAAAGAELRGNQIFNPTSMRQDYGRVFMPVERDGQRVEIEFRPGVKLEAIATLDKLMRHSIDKVTPGHKEATEIKVLPASQHNELTTDGAARIFMDLLPIQTPASFGISDGVDRGKKQIDTLRDRAAARRVAGAAKAQLAVDAKSKGIAAANKAKEAKKRKSPVPAAALTPVPVLVQSDAVGDAFDDGDPGDAFDRRDRRDPATTATAATPAATATPATAATRRA
ncbi:hypothetical protein JL721_8258 [Aureococcus anophagefferens]|nr:hypothetical protein JL721_8258 [Aureococcus anophagefferens]